MKYKKFILDGDLTFMSKIIRKTILLASGKYKFLELDFKKVNSMDSTGIDFLVRLYSKLKNDKGNLRCINVNDSVYNLMEVTKINSVIDTRRKK